MQGVNTGLYRSRGVSASKPERTESDVAQGQQKPETVLWVYVTTTVIKEFYESYSYLIDLEHFV